MENCIILTLKSCTDQYEERYSTVELLGYDFMVDDAFNTWLIEINKSPSTDTNTVKIL